MARIAIFDSGVGGLSIYSEVRQLLPNHDYLFVCDNLGFPYGNKPAEQVLERVVDVVEQVAQLYEPDVLVIACNTASTIVLPELRARHAIPIVGVVPAIKPAANQSKNKHIAILATPATIARNYTQELINEFAARCNVIKIGSSRLVEIAEDKLYGREVDLMVFDSILSPVIDEVECDTLVLACTHFPLLNKEIESIFKQNNREINLVDSGIGIAKRVQSLIESEQFKERKQQSNNGVAIFTKSIIKNNVFLDNLLNLGLVDISVLES